MPREVDEADIIAIQDAMRTYERSRNYFMKRIDDGRLHMVSIDGDIRTLLLRSEIEALIKPKILGLGDDTQEDDAQEEDAG